MEVTVEVTNSGDENLDDVNMQPRWARYTAGQDGAFVLDESIPGYEETGASRGGSRYDIQADNFAYYFDSSAYGEAPIFIIWRWMPERPEPSICGSPFRRMSWKTVICSLMKGPIWRIGCW